MYKVIKMSSYAAQKPSTKSWENATQNGGELKPRLWVVTTSKAMDNFNYAFMSVHATLK